MACQKETITWTFGDCAENHRGMQEIGQKASRGLSVSDLIRSKKWFEEQGKKCELHDLGQLLSGCVLEHEIAYVLVVRDGCSAITNTDTLFEESKALSWDSKAYMYGRVVNKKARQNICVSSFDQEPNYEEGKGTVVHFDKVDGLATIRKKLGEITGEKLVDLQCEGNRYYDVKKTYIGFHGDTERRIVVACRLGEDFPLHYQWFINSNPVGQLFSTVLHHGDIYFMSEKAVGFDWKLKKIPTLRHSAGLLSLVSSALKPKEAKSKKTKEVKPAKEKEAPQKLEVEIIDDE